MLVFFEAHLPECCYVRVSGSEDLKRSTLSATPSVVVAFCRPQGKLRTTKAGRLRDGCNDPAWRKQRLANENINMSCLYSGIRLDERMYRCDPHVISCVPRLIVLVVVQARSASWEFRFAHSELSELPPSVSCARVALHDHLPRLVVHRLLSMTM